MKQLNYPTEFALLVRPYYAIMSKFDKNFIVNTF